MTYYIVTIGGEAKKGCVFKKVVNGKYFVLQKDDANGYVKNKWHQLQVMMSGSTFRFYLSEIDGAVT